jgi:hypothetical protein
MISITLDAETPFELRENAKVVFGLVEPEQNIAPAEDTGPEVMTVAEVAAETAAAPEAKKTRAPRKTKDAPAEAKEEEADPLAIPGFLKRDEAPKEEPAKETPTLTVEDVRAAANKLLGKLGQTDGMKKLEPIVSACKSAEGKVCSKVSQIQPADYAAVVSKINALTEG